MYYKASKKTLPSTTLYYKACTKRFPALLCTTKLAQSTCQYYFVLQSLHKARPSTTLYYKACTKYFPVLLHFTRKNTWFHAPASSPTHAPCNIHAAITMCFATPCAHPCIHYNALCIHALQNTKRRNRLRSKRSQPHSPRTQAALYRPLQPLYTAKCFLPNTSPMQHSWSHYHAFCSTLHTSMQLAITMRFASTRCRTPRRNRLLDTIAAAPAAHTSCPCCSHFTRQNASSPTQVPCKIHAAITMRFAAPRTHPCVAEHQGGNRLLETIAAAPAAHTSSPSSPAAATLHGKPQGFMPRLPPPTQHHFPQSPAFVITTSFSHHHHFPESPLLLGTTSLSHHPSSSPLPLDTTSLSHHPSSSPLHHPSSSPLPLVTTSFSHHHSSSPLPSVTTLRRHHFTALRHDH